MSSQFLKFPKNLFEIKQKAVRRLLFEELKPRLPFASDAINTGFPIEEGPLFGFDSITESGATGGLVTLPDGNNVYRITYPVERDETEVLLSKGIATRSVLVSFLSRYPSGIPRPPSDFAGLKWSRLIISDGIDSLAGLQNEMHVYWEGDNVRYEGQVYIYEADVVVNFDLDQPITEWFEMKYFVSLNTPGRNDGVLIVYFNGQQVAERRDVHFTDNPNALVSTFWVGGNDSFNGHALAFPVVRDTDDVRLIVDADDPLQTADQVMFGVIYRDSLGAVVDRVCEGDKFSIDIYVTDTRAQPKGIFSAGVDVVFGEEAEIAGDLVFGPELPNARHATIGSGQIDELSAVAGIQGAGVNTLLASIPMVASKAGVFQVGTNPADVLPQHEVSLVGTVTSVPASQITFGSGTLMIDQLSRFHNRANSTDVSFDSFTSPVDALRIINALNSLGSGLDLRTTTLTVAQLGYVDTNNDGVLSPLDALLVINELNRQAAA
ncbi:MAG: hypothetical protein KDB03_05035 [Planctomycetales bacterium]|nr:hypothetical protein [Planctomycetales bacterium]